MRHAATRRALCLSACLMWTTATANAERLTGGEPIYDLRAHGAQSASKLPAPLYPSRLSPRGLRLPPGLQLERKAGFQYRTRLKLGDASWVMRFKGPLVKRKRLGLGVEFEF